jgi:hypothetical protein
MSTKPASMIVVRTRKCPTIVVGQDGYDMGLQR